MDTFIFVGFCIFMFLLGLRLKQRWDNRKKKNTAEHINKNQRPKMADAEEPPVVTAARLRRERRVRFFTIAQLILLFGLMIFMLPNLMRDLMRIGSVDGANLFLRCLIFIFTIYIFILGFLKVFRKKKEEPVK